MVHFNNIFFNKSGTANSSISINELMESKSILSFVDDVNLIDDDIRVMKINTVMLLNTCKDIGSAIEIGKLGKI